MLSASYTAITTGTLLAVILAYMQRELIAPTVVLAWLSLTVLVALFRVNLTITYLRSPVNDQSLIRSRLTMFRIGVLTTGVVWGSAGLLMFPSNDPQHQMFLIFMLAGLTAGGVASYSADLASAIGFSVCALAPLIIRLCFDAGNMSAAMGIAAMLYLSFMMIILRHINLNLSENILLQLEATAREETVRASEAKVQRLIKIYAALNQCNQSIVRCTSEDELLPLVCRYAVQLGGIKMAWIGLVDKVTHKVKPVACYGIGTGYLDGIQISVSADEPTGGGPFGIAFREERPVWIQDFRNDQRLAPWHELGSRYGWAGVAALPLNRNGVVIGALLLYTGVIDAFDEPTRNLLEGMTIDISYALTRFALLIEQRKTDDAMRIAAVTFETQEAIMITDADAKILRVNQAFQDITGYSTEEVIGQNPRILQSGRHDAAFYQAMWSALLNTGKWSGEVWDRRKNGEIYPKLMTITAVYDDNHQVTHYVAVSRDISKRKKSEQEIHQLAFYDSLTKLPNRRLLMDRLQQALAVSARNGRHGALLFLDLDHFKTINDTQGHAMGDQLLIEVARRLLPVCARVTAWHGWAAMNLWWCWKI